MREIYVVLAFFIIRCFRTLHLCECVNSVCQASCKLMCARKNAICIVMHATCSLKHKNKHYEHSVHGSGRVCVLVCVCVLETR